MEVNFHIFTAKDISERIRPREGEQKLGEVIRIAENDTINNLKEHPAKYVLIGIPEDIGVRANYGVGGANTAWSAFLNAFLNTQANIFVQADQLLLLGQFEFSSYTETDIYKLRKQVEQIDEAIYPIIQSISLAGKIPILIGGGHNNCFPIIKGVSLAKSHRIDVINLDAHSDLRSPEEGRHSGNGFSTAISQNYLKSYRIMGLQKQYVSNAQLQFMQKHHVKATYLDELLRTNETLPNAADLLIADFDQNFGLEIDLDCISGMLSSASSPSGFQLNDVRSVVKHYKNRVSYLHICEGASELTNGRRDPSIGKAISYLVHDLISVEH